MNENIIPELEEHKIKLHEFGGLEVVPYAKVVEFFYNLKQKYIDELEESIKDFQKAISDLNENID